METPDKKMFLEMQEHPDKFSEEQIDAMVDELDRVPDVESAWQKFDTEHNDRTKPAQNHSSLLKIAASFIGVILLSSIAYAAVRVFTKNKEADITINEQKEPEEKMLTAFFVPKDCKNPIVKKRGDLYIFRWTKGTWIQTDEESFIEEHPICNTSWGIPAANVTVTVDGKVVDIHNLPDLPASAMKKMERSLKTRTINIITTPVQIPADVKGNINPELTILLTGTPPKDSGTQTTIWYRRGIQEGFSWKNYTFCSWKWAGNEDVGDLLAEVAIRKDHHVRINVCRGVPQKHIERIKKLMCDNGVTNYELINQE